MSILDTIGKNRSLAGVLPERYRRTIVENWFPYLLLTPTVLMLIFIFYLPFLRGVWMSFHEWPFLGDPTWIGLGNYRRLLAWDAFYVSLRATLIFSLLTVVQLVIAMAAALAVTNMDRFANLTSAAFLVPFTMPPVVTGTIWTFLLHPNSGPIFEFLVSEGLLAEPLFCRTNGKLALLSIMGITTWTFWPFIFLIFVASLRQIPDEHYESARVYGANRIQRFLKVTLPEMRSAILVAVSLRIIWNLSKVSQPLQMTGGGPGFDTSILAILMYRFARRQGEMGFAYAIGLVLLLVVLAFVFVFIREFERSSRGVGE